MTMILSNPPKKKEASADNKEQKLYIYTKVCISHFITKPDSQITLLI